MAWWEAPLSFDYLHTVIIIQYFLINSHHLSYPRLCYVIIKIYKHFTIILQLNINNYFIREVTLENRLAIVSSFTVYSENVLICKCAVLVLDTTY